MYRSREDAFYKKHTNFSVQILTVDESKLNLTKTLQLLRLTLPPPPTFVESLLKNSALTTMNLVNTSH